MRDRTGTLPARLTAAVVEPAAVLPSRERDAPPGTTMTVTTATTGTTMAATVTARHDNARTLGTMMAGTIIARHDNIEYY
ncbi:hypothetical protein OEA41_002688 [Lepraria neglecta]|uniref:Uncharacterized protein n=1 Tax=Lepraria neglecta TaxID=209136 RepID=A0AAE0DHM0_9LECA|nr:hypothetical protein OEA41_002688 [Lepraria neglecta]